MPRFEMLGGRADIEGKQYTYSERRRTVVETDLPLDKMFKNQWRRLDGATKVPRDHRDTPDHSGTKVMDDLDHKKKKIGGRTVKTTEIEEDDDIVDVGMSRRPRKVARKTEDDQLRGVDRDAELEAQEMEEDEDLPEEEELDEQEGEEDEEEPAEDEADEEEDEEPAPVKVKKKHPPATATAEERGGKKLGSASKLKKSGKKKLKKLRD